MALGVGGVIAGLPLAAADTESSGDPGSATSAGASQSSPANHTATRARARAGSPDRAARGESVQSGTGAIANDRSTRRSAGAGGAVTESAGPAGTRQSSARDSIPTAPTEAASTPDIAAPAAVQIPAPVVSTPSVPEVSPAADLPQIAALATAAAAAVPVMTAAPATAAVSTTTVTGLLAWLGGPGRTDIPAAAPLAWAAAAASRRELSPAATMPASAASVTTGQAVPPSLSDQITGIGILAGLPEQIRAGIGQAAADWIERTLGVSAVNQVSALIAGLGADPTAADIIDGVSDAVSGWWADSDLGDQVNRLFDSVTGGTLGSPQVLAALAGAVGRIVTAADPVAALPEAVRALLADSGIGGAVDDAISGALDLLAIEFGPAVAQAISEWIDDPTLGSVAGAVSGFLDQPGVSAALADAAGSFATAVLTGKDPGAATALAWRSLQAAPAIQAVVDVAVSDAVARLLGDADAVQFLGDAVSGLVDGLAGDAELGELAGSILTGFLGHPGVPAVLADIAGELATAALAGADLGNAVTLAVRSLQASEAVQAAVDLAMSGALGGLLNNDEALQYLSGAVSGLVGGFVGDVAIGARVADQIVPLVFSVLVDGPAAVDDFEDAITELLRELIVTADPGSADLAPALAAVGFTLLRAGLLGDFTAVPATIEELATDTAVLASLSERIAGIDALTGLPVEIRTTLGAAAAYFLEQTLGNPLVAAALTPVFAAIEFPTDATAVADFLDDFLGNGFDVEEVLVGLLGPDVPAALSAFLGDVDVQQAFGDATTGAFGMLADIVSGLLDDSGVRALVGDQIAAVLTALTGDASVAAGLGAAIGDAVLGLLANSAIGDGLSAVAGSVLSGFLGQQGVPAALAQIVSATLTAVLSGTDPAESLRSALQALESDPDVVAGLGATLTAALDTLGTTVFGNAGVQESVGAAVTALLSGFAGEPTVQALIGNLLGADFGPTIVGLLTDPSFGAATAGLLGAAVTDLLGYPGVSAALTDALEQIASAVLGGTDPAAALEDSLQSLAASSAVLAAVEAVLPAYLDQILDNDRIRDGIGAVAQQVVTQLLQDSGIADTGLATAAGQVAEVATISLLANPAFGDLLTDLAGDILGGTPVSEVTDVVVAAVLRDPALQGALGAAVGQGIGSLVGDNLFGVVVGQLAGAVATLVIRVAAGLTLLFNPGLVGAAAASTGKPGGGYFELIPDWDAEVSSITLAIAV